MPVEDLEREGVKNSYLSKEWDREDGPIKYRQVLQWVGTEAMRNCLHTNVWVNALFSEYKMGENGEYPNWIITDVRFPNEAEAIRDRGGVVIRVNRPSIISQSNHPSEISLDHYDFDYVIENDGGLHQLTTRTLNALSELDIWTRPE
jgi:hypothetical protein